MLTLKSMRNVKPITLKLIYHQCTSNYIKLEINIYIEINALNANNQIKLENIYIEINASNVGNQIEFEINIYTEINTLVQVSK